MFSLLACLIENRERVVSKDELIEMVWDGRIVSDGTLNTRINSVRRAVGDDGKRQAVIKTFPRRGFRFVAALDGDFEPPPPAEDSDLPSGKASIAVLPFSNLSGDPEQEYFSGGVSEDIINALGRFRELHVIARTTSFIFKGQQVDVQTIARELEAGYILEGSVRKSGDRIRISTQLIDGGSGNLLWSDHYDRDLEDIFAVQDEITQTVVAAIQPTLAKAERDRATVRNPKNLGAWDFYHRGMSHLFDKGEFGQPREIALAKESFRNCIALDPNFSRAYSGLAHCLLFENILALTDDLAAIIDENISVARKAIALDPEDAFAHMMLAAAYMRNQDPEAAFRAGLAAIEINPRYAWAYMFVGSPSIRMGRAEDGIAYLKTGLRLGKHEPGRGPMMAWLAVGYNILGEYESALDWARQSLEQPTTQFWGNIALVVALVNLDRTEEAIEARKVLQQRQPHLTTKSFGINHLLDASYQKIITDALITAGLPEE